MKPVAPVMKTRLPASACETSTTDPPSSPRRTPLGTSPRGASGPGVATRPYRRTARPPRGSRSGGRGQIAATLNPGRPGSDTYHDHDHVPATAGQHRGEHS